jgi:hypothetical protein
LAAVFFAYAVAGANAASDASIAPSSSDRARQGSEDRAHEDGLITRE